MMKDQELAALLISRLPKIKPKTLVGVSDRLYWDTNRGDFVLQKLASTIYSDDANVEIIALPTEAENTELINIWYQAQCLRPFGLTHPRAEYLAQYTL